MNVLLVGTANRHKVREIREILTGSPGDAGPTNSLPATIRVIGADVLPPGPDVEERERPGASRSSETAAQSVIRMHMPYPHSLFSPSQA